nr:leucine-rich repeat protein [Butyrivibrio sp.]
MKRAFTRSLGVFLAAVMAFSSTQVTSVAADYTYLTQQSSDAGANGESTADTDNGLSGLESQVSSMLESSTEGTDGEDGGDESSDKSNGETQENPDAATGTNAGEENASSGSNTGDGNESLDDATAEITDDAAEELSDEAAEELSDEAAAEGSDEALTGATDMEEEEKDILKAGSWSYYLDEDGYAHIVGFSDTDKSSVTVPKKMGKYFAVAIEDGTFSDAVNLKSVKIPFYIREIGSDAFNSDVTISAYHGAYALDYAANYGYRSTDLSEYDFADGAIDLTEITRSHYFFITDTEIEMNKLEVSYLEDHPVFYLPPSDEISNGDAFKIISKEEAGDNYILHCERAIGSEVLKRLVIDEENLRPDWENAIYYNDSDYDGVYEEYTIDDMEKTGENSYNLYGFGSISTSFQSELNYDISLKIPHKDREGSTQKADVKVEASGSDNTTYSVNVDIDFAKGKVKKFEVIQKKKQEFSFSITGSVSDKKTESKKTIPVAKVPLKQPGLVNIYAVLQLVYSVDGTVSFTYETSETTGFRVVGDEIQQIKDVTSQDTSFEAAVKAKAGIEIGIELDAINKIVSAEAKLEGGVKLEMSRDLSESIPEGKLSAYVKIYVAISVEFFDFLSFDLEKDFLESDYVIKIIPYDKYTVTFSSGKGDNIPAQTVLKGGYAAEPEVGYSSDRKGIQGWYTDPSFTHKWNFETDKVTSDMVLYAKWAKLYAVTYDYNLEGAGVYKAVAVEGAPIGEIGGAKVSNYKFKEWTKDREGKEKWDFETDLMPGSDLTIYAQYEYIEGYNPWDEAVNAGDTIIEDGISYSAEGFEFKTFGSGTGSYAEVTGYKGDGGAVVIPTKTEDGVRVTRLNNGVLSGNKDLTAVKIPNNVSFDAGVLNGCTNVESVSIPDSPYYSGLRYVYNLIYLFNAGYVSGDSSAYSMYSKLKKVVLTGNIAEIKPSTFENWPQLEEICYPDTVTSIGSSAFYGCSGLKNLPISSHITKIDSSAFSSCTGTSRIDIPDSVKTIGTYSFSGCTGVTEVNLPNNGLYVDEYAFSNLTNIKKIVIPSKDYYGQAAFEGCTNVESVSIPSIIRYTYNGGGGDYNLVRLFYGSDNSIASIAKYPKLKKVTLTGNITEIVQKAFNGWSQLEEVSYPDTVTTIRSSAFYGCSGLKTLPISSHIKKIESSAFSSCTGTRRIDIPESVETIGTYSFSGCTGVTEVNLPNNGLYVDEYAFRNLTNIKKIVIPSKDYYGQAAFEGCTNVESVSIPNIIRYTYNGGAGDYNLVRLFYGSDNSIDSIAKYPKLKKVTLTGNITEIVQKAFNGWSQLEEVNYPDTVTSIGNYAFQNCSGLKTFTIGKNVRSISSSAFYGCTGLKKLIVLSDTADISNIPIEASKVLYTAAGDEDEAGQESEPEEDTIIYARPGSRAEQVAKSKGINFLNVDDTFAEVRFDFNNDNPDYVTYGEIGRTVAEPAVPVYTGNVFSGWYYDETLATPWNFDTDILPYGGVTLYADWNASSRSTDNYSYEIKGDFVSITGYLGADYHAVIPEKIDNLPVKEIAEKAFAYDEDIVKITIPRYVDTIASDAFVASANISEFAVSDLNESFAAVDKVLFDKNQESLIAYPAGKTTQSYAVPGTVKTISPNAFNGARIRTVTATSPLQEIGDMAFANCESLESVTLPSTFAKYGKFVFWNNKNVQLYGPVDNAILEAFAADECVDFNLYRLTFISEGNKE